MTTWTSRAHLLAADLPELGMAIAALNAAAWSAGIMPEAIRGLSGAAVALAGDAGGEALWARTEPCPDDATLLSWAAEIEASVAELLKHAKEMSETCQQAHDSAVAEHQAARADADSEADETRALAADRMEQARRVIADTEAALEVLADAIARLGHARTCLARVPGDYAETYHVPIALVRSGLKLPYAGAYLNSSAE